MFNQKLWDATHMTLECQRPKSVIGHAAWRLVCHYLHYSASLLSSKHMWEYFAMCDGFGTLSLAEIQDPDGIGYDWSHVRDSSPEQIEAVARRIAQEQHKCTLEELIMHAYDEMPVDDFWTRRLFAELRPGSAK